MYYSNEQNYNDYYSNYKKELQELNKHNKKENINKLILLSGKILMILFFLTLIYLYIQNVETNEKDSSTDKIRLLTKKKIEKNIKEEENIPPIELDATVLPKSIQLRESQLQSISHIKENATDYQVELAYKNAKTEEKSINMDPKDIALIVQIIMSQIHATQPFHEEDKRTSIVKNKFLEELKKAEKQKTSFKNLREGNYYNKIVIRENTTSTHDKLSKLRDEMNSLIQEKVINNEAKEYTELLRNEIPVRSNEMRIIVVKKGDSLSKLARKAYGNYDAYPKILKANPEIIKNPNQIYAGMRLRIPQY